jgi:hypothetical protein
LNEPDGNPDRVLAIWTLTNSANMWNVCIEHEFPTDGELTRASASRTTCNLVALESVSTMTNPLKPGDLVRSDGSGKCFLVVHEEGLLQLRELKDTGEMLPPFFPWRFGAEPSYDSCRLTKIN